MASVQQTQEQARVAEAWHQVRDQVKNQAWAGNYRALVRSAATDILTNGLGQTLAFLLAKAKGKKDNEHWQLYAHLSAWIKESNTDLLQYLVGKDSEVYRQTTVEVMAYLNWLKRFAEAELPEPKEQ
jgi:CRISPR-associated protein Cmr5